MKPTQKTEATWRRYLRLHRPDPKADFDDELRDHLESTTAQLVKSGLTPDAARDEALRRFGDVSHVRHEVQRMDAKHLQRSRWADVAETFVQDAKFAARVLVRNPAFTVVAALSIAIGVAANTTVFSVVNALLLRSIPGATAPRLMRVYVNHHSPFSYTGLSWFRDQAHSFDGIVGERSGAMSFRVAASGGAERVRSSMVSAGFFSTLGVRMALGSGFVGDEKAVESAVPVVVLSNQFWKRRFAGDSSVIGRVITLSEHPVTVVGVTDANFRSSVVGWAPDVIVPLASAPILSGTKLADIGGSLYTTARLKDGVAAASAASELNVLMARLARTDSARYARMTVRLDHTRGVNAELRAATMAGSAFLMLMVGLVLLIACANVANLLLGRAAARHTEIGVRLAIGAGRNRIIRQLLTESLMLAALGTALGFVATLSLTRMLTAVIPPEAGMDSGFFSPDARVLAFTGFMCLFTTLLFGLVPALRAASPRLVPLIKGALQSEGGRRKRGKLVAAQAALCILLLAVASLFGRSLRSIRSLDSGFRADGVLDVSLDLALVTPNGDEQRLLFARMLQRANELPGVQSAALASLVPLAGSNMETRVAPEGMNAATRFDYPSTYFNVVSAHYFETLGMQLLRGRAVLESDGPTSARVAVVNETAAKRWWPNQEPLGKRFRWGGPDGLVVEVVGVARDADYNMPGEARAPFVYMPVAQEPRSEMVLQLKTQASLPSLRDAVWNMVRTEAPMLPPPPVTRMTDDMAITLLPLKVGAALLGALGGAALLLAAAGIYGVTTFAVTRRTREMGIRAALGAGRSKLLQTVVFETLKPVANGVAIGLVLALLAAFGLGRVLYGVHTFDPVVLPGVTIMLAAVAVVASLIPAWRAATIDPVRAIRNE